MTQDEFSPYVGPRPFERNKEDSTRFFGRSHETQEIISLIFGHPITLVYAQSGAGKTSLFNASITPELEKNGFEVLPLTRVGGIVPKDVAHKEIKNLYIFNALLKMDSETAPQDQLMKSLSEFLNIRPRKTDEDDQPSPRAIVFDQFEELFTYTPQYWREQRNGFFQQIVEALDANPLLRVVFVIREDFLAELDPYARNLPERMRIRYRLERLGENAALQAIKDPLTSTSRRFASGVAEELVNELLVTKSVDATGKMADVDGQYVEPVQLQVVCVTLWSTLEPDVIEIQKGHLENFDVNDALSVFYNSTVKFATEQTSVSETNLRNWFGRTLITPMGTRSTVFRGETSTGGIENSAIDFLESHHIIRAEFRAGARWYELTHDRLIEPIQASNTKWFSENLNAFQQQAALWIKQGRPDGMLLRGSELEQAEIDSEHQAITEDEQAYLYACIKARDRERREKRRNRWVQVLAILAVIAGVVAGSFARQANIQTEAAQTALTVAQSAVETATFALGDAISANAREASLRGVLDADRLSLQAQDALRQSNTVDLGQLLAVEAYKINYAADPNGILPSVYQALFTGAGIGNDRYLSSGPFSYGSFGSDSNKNWLILDEVLWNLTTAQSFRLINPDEEPRSAFLSNGNVVLVTGETGYYPSMVDIYVMDKANPIKDPYSVTVPEGTYRTDIDLSGDGQWVIASYRPRYNAVSYGIFSGGVLRWDILNRSNPPIRLEIQSSAVVDGAAISQNGKKVAVVDNTDLLYLWKGEGPLVPVIRLDYNPVNGTMIGSAGEGLQFSRDGRWLAVLTEGYNAGAIVIFDTDNVYNSYLSIPLDSEDRILGFRFSPLSDSFVYVTSSYEYCYRYYYEDDCRPSAKIVKVPLGGTANISPKTIFNSEFVDFTAMDINDNNKLAVGDDVGNIYTWDLNNETDQPSVTLAHAGRVVSIIIDPDTESIVSSGEKDGTRLWSLSENEPSAIIIDRIPSSILDVKQIDMGHQLVIAGEYKRNNVPFVSVRLISNLEDTTSIDELPLVSLQGNLQAWAVSDRLIAAARVTEVQSYGTDAYNLDFWDLESATSTAPSAASFPLSFGVRSLALDETGSLLAILSNDGELWVDTTANLIAQSVKTTVASTPSDLLNEISSTDEETEFATKLSNELGDILTLRFAGNGKYLIAANEISMIVWDMTDLQNPIPYRFGNAAYPVHISTDKEWMVTGGVDDILRFYSIEDMLSDEYIPIRVNMKAAITRFAFSPDGTRMAVTTEAGNVQIYQLPLVDGSEPIYTLDGPSNPTWLEFSPISEGQWLVAASGSYAHLWNLDRQYTSLKSTNENPIYLQGHRGDLTYAGFTDNGKWVMTIGTDQTLRFWTMDLNELINATCMHAGRNLTFAEMKLYFKDESRKTCDDYSLEENLPTPTAGVTETPAAQFSVILTATSTPTPSYLFKTYTVKSEDTLGLVSLKCGVDINTLVADNNIANVNIISVGQLLKIRTANDSTLPEFESLHPNCQP